MNKKKIKLNFSYVLLLFFFPPRKPEKEKKIPKKERKVMKKEEEEVCGFRKEYRFLSNFYPCTVYFNRVLYRTSEHAFQASKTFDMNMREKIFLCPSAKEAKKLGHESKLRPDWEEVKEDVMRNILFKKFYKPTMLHRLLDTGDKKLIESNTWGDTYWGVCNGKGKNRLGELLMEIRLLLRKKCPVVAIVGSRSMVDYEYFLNALRIWTKANNYYRIRTVVSGGAKGADTLAAKYAKERGARLVELRPDWKTHGKKAGILRNTDIVKAAECVVAFPLNDSIGTWDTVEKAKKFGVPVSVFQKDKD